MRILSLLPSATEIVYALGLGDQLEGVTFECDHPADARTKPVVSRSGLEEGLPIGEIDEAVRAATADGSPLYRLDEALIATIQPDLILTQDLCRVCAVPSGDVDDALDRLGCRAQVISLDPHTLDEVIDDVERVARAAGVADRGAEVAADLRTRLDAASTASAPNRAGRPKVLVLEWVDPPWGPGHWIPDMVERAGGDPVLARAGGHAETFTWQEVTAAAPDVVVVSPCGFHLEAAAEQARSAIPALASTPAGRAGRVWAIDADAYVVRPGPRTVDGVEVLSWIIGGGVGPPPLAGAATRV